MLLACSEGEEEEEPFTCDGELGRFEYLDFEPGFDPVEQEHETCTPCILRGGSFTVEFVAHEPVEGDVSVRSASDDYLREQSDGTLLARRSGEPAILAWGDGRVLDIALLEVVDVEDIVVSNAEGMVVSEARLRPDDTLELDVRTTPGTKDDCIGAFELRAASRDDAVATASVSGTTVELLAVAHGEAVVDIEYAGQEYAVVVTVETAEREPDEDESGSESSSGGSEG